MNYNGLVSFPGERTRVTFPWVYWDGTFTPEELDKIIEHCQVCETKKAEVLGGPSQHRTSHITFHNWSPEIGWVFDRLIVRLCDINNRWYGFALNGFGAFQYTEYYAEENGKYDWHMDLCMGTDCLPADMIEPRKLSISLLLNDDFEGGEFEINSGREDEARPVEFERGRIIAFPSWMIHRVKPVTKGVRKSLVVWVTGPKFT
jgi:PKHD-type hydroxylase